MKASDIMTPNPIWVDPTASVIQAARLMLQHHISGLPVVAGSGTLLGIITEADILARAATATRGIGRHRWLKLLAGPDPLAPQYGQLCRRKVHEVMSPEVFTASEDTTVETMVQIMEQRRIKRLPILRGAKLVGIVSRANLVRAVARMARLTKLQSRDHEVIRPHAGDRESSRPGRTSSERSFYSPQPKLVNMHAWEAHK
jgi:CBS domain-containing protein